MAILRRRWPFVALALLCLRTLTLTHAFPSPNACDDSNSCTFDWLENTPDSDDATAASTSVCQHEFIPPICQPLLVHSTAPAYSSLNAHGLTFDVRSTPPSTPQKLTERLMAEPLDIVLFVPVAGDADVTVQRTWTFLEILHELNFHGANAERLQHSPLQPLQPFWTLHIYNHTHSRLVQPLTRSFSTLRHTVRHRLLTQIREMRTEPMIESTPVGVYRALGAFLSAPPNRTAPVYRPHAHQHVIVLAGIGVLTGTSADTHLRTKETVVSPAAAKECESALADVVGALSAKTGPASTRSSSFALFYLAAASSSSSLPSASPSSSSSAAETFWDASIGSVRHTHAYPFDGSEYNMALTLRNVIRDKTPTGAGMPSQQSSFLAQTLSRGYTARVYDIGRLETTWDDQLAHVWEPHYRHPRSLRPWCSAMQAWTCDPMNGWFEAPTMPCGPGQVPSAIHGCYTPLPKGTVKAEKARLGVEQVAGITSAGPRGGEQVDHDSDASEEEVLDASREDVNGEIEVIVNDAGATVNPLDALGMMSAITSDGSTSNSTAASPSSVPPLALEGAPFPLFHTAPYTSGSHRYTRDQLRGRPATPGRRRRGVEIEVKQWTPSLEFTREIIAGGRPVVLKNTVVSTWPALRKWNAEYLRDAFASVNATMSSTKISRTRKFFDPDRRTPLSLPSLVNLTMTYQEVELTPEELFGNVTKGWKERMGVEVEGSNTPESTILSLDEHVPPSDTDDPLYYHFGSFPPSLLPDITPYASLYSTSSDLSKNSMFLWTSSAGVNMHTHFDQDHNFFVQLVGRKRFTLVRPEQWRRMHLFPRIHPLWHKSQVDADEPDLELFGDYAEKVEAEVVEIGPGDVLYIPPYCWHQVDTLTPSISMSIWSHDTPTVQLMERVYKHDHKIDLLSSRRGRIYALRLYIDLMIYEMYGAQRTTGWIQELVQNRYRPLVDIFREEDSLDASSSASTRLNRPPPRRLCPVDQIPTAHHVYGDAVLDKSMMSANFDVLQPIHTRDILFIEYLEELTAAVVGPLKVMRFFMECFQGQTYRVTDVNSEEHAKLWAHV